MNCPSCGAPMHSQLDSFHCDYCNSIVVPNKNDDGVIVLAEAEPAQPCPTCSQPLKHASLARVPMLYCDRCCGMLIPMDVFEPVLAILRDDQTGTAVEPPSGGRDLNRKIACPHCARTMDTHPYFGPGNVILDSCETCLLLWLDHGELKRIVRAEDDRVPSFSADDSVLVDPSN